MVLQNVTNEMFQVPTVQMTQDADPDTVQPHVDPPALAEYLSKPAYRSMEVLDSPEMIQLVHPLPDEHVKDCLERRLQLLTKVVTTCNSYALVVDIPYDEDTSTYDLALSDYESTSL